MLKAELQALPPVQRADRMGDEIARLSAQMTVGEHRLVHAIADFDEAGAFVEHGALTTVQWLGYRVGMSASAASERLRVGRALKSLPAIDAAFEQAQVSYSKVRALTRVATPDNEQDLLGLARTATAHQLEQICRKYRVAMSEATAADATTSRFVQVRQTDDGSTRLTIQLPPDEGARLLAALDAARAELATSGDDQRPDRADAVMALAESFFASGLRSRKGGAPHEVVVHVDADRISAPSAGNDEPVGHVETTDQGVGAETARRLCCDASVSALVVDGDGRTLDAGRKRRTVPAPMRRALAARAEHRCQFPGCTHRHFLDAHHIEHWANGGATRLDNLVLLCRRHHVFVHEHGWTLRRGPSGEVQVRSPQGRTLGSAPRFPAEDLTALVDASGRRDLDGLEPVGQHGPADYAYIIDLLMPRPARVRA